MSDSRSIRILVAEDDGFNQLVIHDMLEIIIPEAEIVTVANGADALAALAAGPFDLVFSDIDMPVMDGMAMLQRIKAEPGLIMPVIAVTAFAVVGDRERLLLAGFDDYVSKPIVLDHLRDAAVRHLGLEVPS
jgi:two-component system cell cycle response regulator DivK